MLSLLLPKTHSNSSLYFVSSSVGMLSMINHAIASTMIKNTLIDDGLVSITALISYSRLAVIYHSLQ